MNSKCGTKKRCPLVHERKVTDVVTTFDVFCDLHAELNPQQIEIHICFKYTITEIFYREHHAECFHNQSRTSKSIRRLLHTIIANPAKLLFIFR